MFELPTINTCKNNKQILINKWLNDKPKHIPNDKLIEARRFFENCNIYHHFIVNYSWEKELNNRKIPKSLMGGFVKSNALLDKWSPVSLNRTLDFDKFFNLDQYVYFSFGMPVARTGPWAMILASPLKALINEYRYPHSWASWGDIIILADKIFGEHFSKRRQLDASLQEMLLKELAIQYSQTIILVEDIPDIAAYFAILNYSNYSDAIVNEWKTKNNNLAGYQGPEIKVQDFFPLKYASHCFVNSNNSLAGKLAELLYQEGLLRCKPIIAS
ncbi:MAG: hypothetical protein K6T65_07940 [Peptococcaceae bacterium]|nr:hypothetical protein [Peptococcaceae bacterium]